MELPDPESVLLDTLYGKDPLYKKDKDYCRWSAGNDAQCNKFAKTNVKNSISHRIDFFIEAKLTDQVWEIEVPITLNKKFSINKELIKKEFNKKYPKDKIPEKLKVKP